MAVGAIAGFIVHRLWFAPTPVEAWTARPGTVAAEVMGTGTFESRHEVTVGSKITGRIERLLVDQNDRVAAGQLIAVLDDGELRQQVAIARASLAAARAGADRAAADIASALATERQARREHERNSGLTSASAISPIDLDKSAERLDVAAADSQRARAARAEADRQVVAAEETLRYHEARLGDTEIRSPIDGLVVRKLRAAGDVVVPGSDIVKVIDTGRMWVSAWVDESAFGRIEPGQPARIVFRSAPDRPCPGVVARVAPQADRETREILVDVEVREMPRAWAAGQRAEVYIQTGQRDDVIVVPPKALAWRDGRPGVFVDDGGRARWRDVTIGLRGADSVEVARGLVAGDVAVAPAGSGDLRDGTAIRIR